MGLCCREINGRQPRVQHQILAKARLARRRTAKNQCQTRQTRQKKFLTKSDPFIMLPRNTNRTAQDAEQDTAKNDTPTGGALWLWTWVEKKRFRAVR
jgi:hypothetical protein